MNKGTRVIALNDLLVLVETRVKSMTGVDLFDRCPRPEINRVIGSNSDGILVNTNGCLELAQYVGKALEIEALFLKDVLPKIERSMHVHLA
jgi:hypothetical protein